MRCVQSMSSNVELSAECSRGWPEDGSALLLFNAHSALRRLRRIEHIPVSVGGCFAAHWPLRNRSRRAGAEADA